MDRFNGNLESEFSMRSDVPRDESIARMERLIEEVEQFADPAARSHVQQIVQGLLDYHGAAVTRMVEMVEQQGSPRLLDLMADDDLVASVLLLYNLHPLPLEVRVEQALEKVRPYLKSHGGNVALLGIREGVVRLRMQGSCHGCPSSAATMKGTIEEAVYAAAPDAAAIEVEGVVEEGAGNGSAGAAPAGFVPLAALAGVGSK